MSNLPWIVITPGQLHNGYYTLAGNPLRGDMVGPEKNSYKVVKRLPDGNFLVEDPDPAHKPTPKDVV